MIMEGAEKQVASLTEYNIKFPAECIRPTGSEKEKLIHDFNDINKNFRQ